MKRKELKALATKIAKQQLIIERSTDSQATHQAEETIIQLSSHVDKLEDMVAIDEIVQEILEKELKNS